MIRTISAFAFAVIGAAGSLHAQTLVVAAEPFFQDRLGPGELAFFQAVCEFGDVISGGYEVNTRPSIHSYAIERSFPENARSWTIQILNISDRPIEIGGRVYAICMEQ